MIQSSTSFGNEPWLFMHLTPWLPWRALITSGLFVVKWKEIGLPLHNINGRKNSPTCRCSASAEFPWIPGLLYNSRTLKNPTEQNLEPRRNVADVRCLIIPETKQAPSCWRDLNPRCALWQAPIQHRTVDAHQIRICLNE